MKKTKINRVLRSMINNHHSLQKAILEIKYRPVEEQINILDDLKKIGIWRLKKHQTFELFDEKSQCHIFNADENLEVLISHEFDFLMAVLVVGREKISAFLNERKMFEKYFMQGNYDRAIKCIDCLVNKYGASLWSLDAYVNTLSAQNINDAAAYVKELQTKNKNVLLKAYVEINMHRFSINNTPKFFQSQWEIIWDKYKDGMKEDNFHRAFKNYFDYRINDYFPIGHNEIRDLLFISNNLSLIDKYCLLEKMAPDLYAYDRIYGTSYSERIIKNIFLFENNPNMPSFDNLKWLSGISAFEDYEQIKRNNHLEQLFCTGKLNECSKQCIDILMDNANDGFAIHMLAKLGNELNDLEYPWAKLARYLSVVYKKNSSGSKLVHDVYQCESLKRVYGNFSFGREIAQILCSETDSETRTKKFNLLRYLTSANFISSRILYVINNPVDNVLMDFFRQHIDTIYSSAWEVFSLDINPRIFQVVIVDDISRAVFELSTGNEVTYEETEAVNEHLRGVVLARYYNKKFTEFVDENQFLSAVKIYNEAHFCSKWYVILMNIYTLNSKLTHTIKKNLAKSMDYTIYTFITELGKMPGLNNMSQTLAESCTRVLHSIASHSFLDIEIPSSELEKKKILFFLKEICTYECLLRCYNETSTETLYRERLQILEKILPYYDDKEVLSSIADERNKIEHIVEQLGIDRCLNRGKFNTEWIVFSLESEEAIMSTYQTYVSNIGEKTFEQFANNFFVVKRNYILEVNRIMSISIRHGILENELMHFYEKCGLSFKCLKNPEDSPYLKQIYSNLKYLVDELLENYLVAIHHPENEPKLLLYVPDDALEEGYENLSVQTCTPEVVKNEYKKILDKELDRRLRGWRLGVCLKISQTFKDAIDVYMTKGSDELKSALQNLNKRMGFEVEKIQSWMELTENQSVRYKLDSLASTLENESDIVYVKRTLKDSDTFSGNTLNFFYTICQELIINAEKYGKIEDDTKKLRINFEIQATEDKVIFIQKNKMSMVHKKGVEDVQKLIGEFRNPCKVSIELNNQELIEGKTGYPKILRLLERNYKGAYLIDVDIIEEDFQVVISYDREELT